MRRPLHMRNRRWLSLFALVALTPSVRAAEHVVLKNGFEVDCVRHEYAGDHLRLYLSNAGSYMEVASDAIARVEPLAEMPAAEVALTPAKPAALSVSQTVASQTIASQTIAAAHVSGSEMHTMLSHAGDEHNIDEDLLASLVKAESGGQVHAVSRTGARGLMQLMPGTAAELGVKDAFRPDENIAGGSAYLDQLLKRYHDNVALALAAYNAGPLAVDRYHGIPPYHETQAYVARVIREFNRRKLAARASARTVAQAQ